MNENKFKKTAYFGVTYTLRVFPQDLIIDISKCIQMCLVMYTN